MSYKSPIEIFDYPNSLFNTIEKATKDIRNKEEEYVYKYVKTIGVNVDKEELLRALQYDREQYYRGHFDGYFDAMNEYKPRWILTTEGLPESEGYYLVTINGLGYNYSARKSETRNDVGIRYFATDNEGVIVCPNGVIAWMPLPEP